MGQMKHLAAKLETGKACAQQVAMDAHVLKQCQDHPDIFLRTGEDIEGAYRLASSYFKDGYYHDLFTSQRNFTDTIKKVVEEAEEGECSSCQRLRRQFDRHAASTEADA